MSTDEQLLVSWRAGETAAGNELVQRHFSTVYCFFWSKVGAMAEDLTQRTFLACVEGQERLRNTAGFRAYLLGIARRILFRYFREVRRRDGRTSPIAYSIHDGASSPSTRMAARDDARVLLLVLRNLPLDLQMVLELYYWENMSMEEIGAVLEIPAGTVKSRLFRGRRMAQQLIRRFADQDALRRTTQGNFSRWAEALRGRFGSSQVP